MTWTYTNNPLTVELDQIRLLIGDVDGDDPQLTDQELNYYLSTEGSVYRAASAACRGLMALFARKADKSVGDLRLSYSQRQAHYAALATALERRAATTSAVPYLGGSSRSDVDNEKSDTDRTVPSFEKNQFEPTDAASVTDDTE